jgi:hypothetical protein
VTSREDRFDWSHAWEIETAGGESFFAELQHSQNPVALYESLMGEPVPKSCVPPGAKDVRQYEEYMTDVAAALRLPPSEMRQQFARLQGKERSICEAIQRIIPSPERVNDARIEVVSARETLLQALLAK